MSISVTCPNGHELSVKDSFAGKAGLCPKCKARVQVPELPPGDLSEDSIMDILGPSDVNPVPQYSAAADSGYSGPAEHDPNAPPKKSCHKCNREISAAIHICPFCHTYIAELTDF